MNAPQEAPVFLAGASLAFALGQFVALRSGHTGHVIGLSYDSETGQPIAEVELDAPIVIPKLVRQTPAGEPEIYPELNLWRQRVALSDLRPADENAAIRQRLGDALRKAEAFIRGFEGDELQQDIAPLLQQTRDALRLVEA